jgi:hypothetical protein
MTRGGFKFVVRQLGRGCCPDISVPTQAPSSCGVRVCIETEMSFLLQIVAGKHHNLSHFKLEATRPNKSPEPTAVGAVGSAIAVHVASRRWLSFLR